MAGSGWVEHPRVLVRRWSVVALVLIRAGEEARAVRKAAGAVAAAAAVLLLLLLLAADDDADAAGGSVRCPADAAYEGAGGVGGDGGADEAAGAVGCPCRWIRWLRWYLRAFQTGSVIWIINSSVLCVCVILQTKTNMCTHPT